MRLIIDPGHGGKDSGGGSNKYWLEKDFVLEISKYQQKRFKDLGVDVSLTRDEDIYLPAKQRSKIVRDSKAKICISNHINAGGGDGAETIHSIYNNGELATKIAKEIEKQGQNIRRVFSRKGKSGKDYYYMHRLTGSVTTIIVEYGFADSKKDDIEQLQRDWMLYAEAVVKAVCEHENIKYIKPNNNKEKLEEIANIMITNNISIEDIEKYLKDSNNGRGRYYKIRRFDTDIHIYETGKNESIMIDLGKFAKKEKLSDLIENNKYKEVAAINGGFFDAKGPREHLGSLGMNGLHYYNPDPLFIDMIIYSDGHSEVRHIQGNGECIKLQAQKAIYFGTSWSLIRNGEIDITNTKIDHHKYRHPRTMLGQKKDGTWLLVVADGRRKDSKGLTSEQQAKVMHELGANNAVNLDGGGSSQMIVDKKIKNIPSDKIERKIGSSIIVKVNG